MKRVDNLYEKIYDFDNIMRAIHNASKGGADVTNPSLIARLKANAKRQS